MSGGPVAVGPPGHGDRAVVGVDEGVVSSRRGLEGLQNRCPLSDLLPPVFHQPDDPRDPGPVPPFALRLCAGLDEVLAPVVVTLDCLGDYLDPALSPPDFLGWLAQWLGLALDQNWPEAKRRALVGAASELYRWEGTVRGIGSYVRLLAGVEPEVVDNGGVAWSAEPGGELPGGGTEELVVRVPVRPGTELDPSQLEAVVAAAKPAHLPHRVELVPPDLTDGRSP